MQGRAQEALLRTLSCLFFLLFPLPPMTMQVDPTCGQTQIGGWGTHEGVLMGLDPTW